jgi:hypothetical protein
MQMEFLADWFDHFFVQGFVWFRVLHYNEYVGRLGTKAAFSKLDYLLPHREETNLIPREWRLENMLQNPNAIDR